MTKKSAQKKLLASPAVQKAVQKMAQRERRPHRVSSSEATKEMRDQVSSRQSRRNTQMRGGSPRDLIEEAKMVAAANARDYLAALYDPLRAGKGCRIPDLLSLPTATATSVTRVVIATVVNGSLNENVVNISPCIGVGTPPVDAKILWGATYAAGVIATAAGVNDADLGGTAGAAITNWQQHRCVAMGVRMLPSAAALNVGGQVAVALIPTGPGNTSVGASFGQTNGLRDAAVYELADLKESDIDWAWHPGTYAGNLDMIQTTADGSTPATQGPYLQVAFSTPTAQAIEFEVITHYEFVPKPSTAALFDAKICIGNPAATAQLQNAIDVKVQGAVPNASPFYATLATKALSAIAATGGSVFKAVAGRSNVADAVFNGGVALAKGFGKHFLGL